MVKTHELWATIIPFNTKRKCCSNITGAFPHKSILGNLYFMVMYDYGSNTILAEPVKNSQEATIRDAFTKMHKILNSIGSNPRVYIMYNDCSSFPISKWYCLLYQCLITLNIIVNTRVNPYLYVYAYLYGP